MPSASFAPSRSDRIALILLQLGVIAVVLAALPYKTFDLDRYFVPKELALSLFAAGAAMLTLTHRGRLTLARVDWLIIGYLVLSTLSAAFAENWWLAQRALAVSLAGAALFWVARAQRRGGRARPILWAVAIAGTIGALTALLQAYGVTSEYFSLNRAPGGTFGNRNFMAHLGAITAPVLIYCTLTTRSSAAALFASTCAAIIAAAEVLSRSRAAWLALVLAFAPALLLGWLTRRSWVSRETRQRLTLTAAMAAAAVAAALLLPNTLEWKSDNPYLESVRGIVNYQKGSGRGRLVQYTNSLRMLSSEPLLGVGPGNWSVEYPRFASRNDPSLTSADEGMTSNPWPSSDWVAFAAERGVPAVLFLALTFLSFLMLATWHVRVSRGAEPVLGALALGATVIATLVVGAFDAVLLLAPATFVVWLVLGALSEPLAGGVTSRRGATLSSAAERRGPRQWAPVLVFALGAVAVARSVAQIASMDIANGTTRLSALERASQLDPGSARIHMRLAEGYLAAGRCDRARTHARAARALYPVAEAPRQVLGACGESSPRVKRR